MKFVDSPGRLASGLGGLLALLSLLLSGCPGQSTTAGRNRGDELLEQVQAAYQRAQSYADAGELTQPSPEDGRTTTIPFSVAYAKPDKLRVEANDVSVVCDGKHLWSAIAHKFLAGQVLFLPAPAEMSLDALYHEPLLKNEFGGDDGRFPLPQLELLLANQPLKRLFGDDMSTKYLGERTLPNEDSRNEKSLSNDSLYHVVEVTGSRGNFVLWIDPKSHVLRRLEITDPDDRGKSLLSISFKGAQLDGRIGDNAFKFEAPATANLVNRFVLPPPELLSPPSEFLGQQPGAFKFIDSEGNPVDAASLSGRVVVFDMWSMSGEYCFESLPNLEKVYRNYRDNPKVAIFAVNNVDVGNKDVPIDALRDTFTSRGLDLPILRDPDRFWQSVFKVPGWPTMIILGADGTVQAYEVGFEADLAETLPKKIDQLLAGENLADQTLASYRRLRAEYERHLAEATVGVTQEIELPRAQIAPRSEPGTLKIDELWTTDNIKNPGNLVVYPDAEGQPTIAVFDGWRTIVELDGAGKTLARHELDLPEDGVATLLRTAVDGQGRRTFAAFAAAQHKVYLMDERWRPAGSYPEETRQGISDVQLTDLDGDGQLEMLVGYLGEVGVQCASLAPERIWFNRAFDNVLSLAVLRRDPDGHCRLLVGNERPALGVLDYAGTQLADVPVPNRPIDIIVAADLASPANRADQADLKERGLWRLAALSATKPAEFVAVGLDFHGSELWSYPYPVGVRNTPCDVLLAGNLRSGQPGQWLLTGADGSIHILDADGELLDRFQYGDELTGIGTMTVAGQPVLLVATAHGLTAWKVTDGDAADGDTPDLGSQASEPAEEPSDEPIKKTAARKPESEAGE